MTAGLRWRGWAAALALLALAAGCEEAAVAVKDAVVETHRQEARGRVGVLRALEVSDTAARLARTLDAAGDPRCGQLSGAFTATITLDAELVDPRGRSTMSLREERRVVRDQAGALSVHYITSFSDDAGRADTVERQERVVEGGVFVKEHNLPWVRRRAHPEDEAVLWRGMDALPALLAVGGGSWTPVDGEDGVFGAVEGGAGEAIRCRQPPRQKGWLHRLMSRSELVEARVDFGGAAEPGVRTLSARLVTVGERRWELKVDVEERVVDGVLVPVEAPVEVAEVRRDRPWVDITTILERRMGLDKWEK